MPAQSATDVIPFAGRAPLPLTVDFLGGRLTSDGGLPWLAEADEVLGLCATLAGAIPEFRTHRGVHDLVTLVRQRVFQIACGYPDQNDAEQLRHDPLLKAACGRLPLSGADLASQPTLSRLETSITARTCYRLAVALGEVYLQERGRDGVPTRIVLDLDGTDDPTHGAQEQTAYHAYYGQHQYFPLLVFDGETDQLITAVLRPGTVHASHGIVPILKRIVAILRGRWPAVAIEVRADSGFAVPALYAYCEAAQLPYTLGLAKNPRLTALAAPLQAAVDHQFAAGDGTKVKTFGEVRYHAGSWPHARRVVVKAEHLPQGTNTRYVVTTRTDAPADLYGFYTGRGEMENWIKDLKSGCAADRLSCHTFWANQFRLLLHAAAYWLLDTVRRWLLTTQVTRVTLATLRLRLLKVGGWVREQADQIRVRLASSHPGEDWWHRLATRPDRSPGAVHE
jgi:DDE family transposase